MTATQVRKIRDRLRWSQKKLANQLGVTTRTVQNWEAKGCTTKTAVMVLKTLE